MFKFKVNKNGEAKWYETEAICIEDAVKNVFNDLTVLWDTKDNIDILMSLESDQLYGVKEIK